MEIVFYQEYFMTEAYSSTQGKKEKRKKKEKEPHDFLSLCAITGILFIYLLIFMCFILLY